MSIECISRTCRSPSSEETHPLTDSSSLHSTWNSLTCSAIFVRLHFKSESKWRMQFLCTWVDRTSGCLRWRAYSFSQEKHNPSSFSHSNAIAYYIGCISIVRELDSPTLLHNIEKKGKLNKRTSCTNCIEMFIPLIWKKKIRNHTHIIFMLPVKDRWIVELSDYISLHTWYWVTLLRYMYMHVRIWPDVLICNTVYIW